MVVVVTVVVAGAVLVVVVERGTAVDVVIVVAVDEVDEPWHAAATKASPNMSLIPHFILARAYRLEALDDHERVTPYLTLSPT